MTLVDIQKIFNRALESSFDKTKLLITFLVLVASGVFVVFCRALASGANMWIAMSLTFLPIFLLSGILLALGVVLIRCYHDEIKKKEINYKKIISSSWEIVLGTAYFSVPILLLYLILWMFLGIFLLLEQIPGIGEFFAVILSFAPFLINFATLLLCVFTIFVLFFVTPIVALRGLNRAVVSQVLFERVQRDLFSNLFLFVIGIFPLLIYLGLLTLAAILTGNICPACNDSLRIVLQWFFIMIPFTALLAPAVIFFFNFAAESHVMLQKKKA